ncbi:MAG: NHLP bacteriocin system secretion protein [Cyanobacteria bacterium P01_F01_bin.42]
MTSPNRNIFRQESLDRLSSPDQLDSLMQVITPRAWLGVLGLGVLLGGGVIWSIVGRIPQRVSSAGVILNASQVVELQSPVEGQIKALNMDIGDCVQAASSPRQAVSSSIIAAIHPSDLEQQRQQQQLKLAKLEADHRAANTLESQRLQLETDNLRQARSQLNQRLQDSKALNPQLKDRSNIATQEQRSSLQQQLADLEKTTPVFEERLNRRRFLLEKGAITQDTVLQAEQEYLRNLQELSQLQAQIKTLDVTDTETEQRFLNTFTNIAEIEAQLRNLDSQINQLQQQVLTSQSSREKELLAVVQLIQQLDKQIVDNSTIISPHTGCITEMKIAPGQMVGKGSPLALIQLDRGSQDLEAIAYFPLQDGKQIKTGMSVQVVPTSVKRERFGAMVGEVTQVSSLPSSMEAIARIVGNAQLAEQLAASGPPIEVRVALQESSDSATGFAWTSSQGPQNLLISSGMTTSNWVTLESRPPITFVMPILRKQFGLD